MMAQTHSEVDLMQVREAKVVFAGIAAITKGTMVQLEYPRAGKRLGGVSEDASIWLSPGRMYLPSFNVVHVARDGDKIAGAFHWTGRTSSMVEVVVRKCLTDSETQQTYLDVDIVAERKVAPDGQITTSLPTY